MLVGCPCNSPGNGWCCFDPSPLQMCGPALTATPLSRSSLPEPQVPVFADSQGQLFCVCTSQLMTAGLEMSRGPAPPCLPHQVKKKWAPPLRISLCIAASMGQTRLYHKTYLWPCLSPKVYLVAEEGTPKSWTPRPSWRPQVLFLQYTLGRWFILF